MDDTDIELIEIVITLDNEFTIISPPPAQTVAASTAKRLSFVTSNAAHTVMAVRDFVDKTPGIQLQPNNGVEQSAFTLYVTCDSRYYVNVYSTTQAIQNILDKYDGDAM